MRFADYYWAILFLAIPYLWFLKSKSKPPSLPHPDLVFRLKKLSASGFFHNTYKIYLPRILRLTALGFLILGIMRPQRIFISDIANRYGVDIIVCLDVSSSMLAEDFTPNRITAAKDVLSRFIKGRPNDRIGLIVFGSQSYIQCPLTNDHNAVLYFLENTSIGMAEDGTAIGMALANAVKRLKDSQAKSKVILLLTDGDNNAGAIDPETAAKLAATYNIKIYSVGIGNPEGAPIPVGTDPWGRKVYARNPDGSLFLTKMNAEGLRKISEIANGTYFIAKDAKTLNSIFKEIDSMEKTKFESRTPYFYDEKFKFFTLAAFFLIIAEYLLVKFLIKPFPSETL